MLQQLGPAEKPLQSETFDVLFPGGTEAREAGNMADSAGNQEKIVSQQRWAAGDNNRKPELGDGSELLK